MAMDLITINESKETYLKASVLARWLGYQRADSVAQIYKRRGDDFNDGEAVLDKSGNLLLNFEGSMKICMFSGQPKAKEARDKVIKVYKDWRMGTLSSYQELSPAEQAYQLASSVMKLAEEQIKQEKTLQKHEDDIKNIDNRVRQIEAKSSQGFISESQKSAITVLVRELGQLLSAFGGRNMYGTVYTKLYEEFGVSSYKNIPFDMYDDVIAWLGEHKKKLLKELAKKESVVKDDDLPF